MIASTMRGIRLGLALTAAGAIAAAAAAQQPARVPPGAVVQPTGRDNGAELRRHLTILADNPRSLDALIGAGRAALQTGDAAAALSFFGRADELAPRNARVRAGMASSLVQLGRARAALQLFAEAVAFGAPAVEIAGDRGLAFDMVGDPRRAQQDYALALRRRDDAEIRRRMALSLAISGQRDAALQVIEAQLRRNDRAAWRTQAFVLALTGDAAGAGRTAQGAMPPGAAQAMAPFLARLAHLSPAQKAMAVHFGHFPSDGRAAAAPPTDISADPGAVALAMGGVPPAAAPRPRPAEPVQTRSRRRAGESGRTRPAPRRRADRTDSSDPYGLRGVSPPVRRVERPAPAPVEVARAEPRRTPPPPAPPQPRSGPAAPAPQPAATAPPSSPPAPAGPSPQPVDVATATRAPTPAAPAPVENIIANPIVDVSVPPSAPPSQPAPASDASPGFTLGEPPAAPANVSPPPLQPSERAPLADIASIVNALPAEEAAAAAPPRPRPAPARPAPARARPAPPSHPARHWVQIATVPDRAALAREFARLRARAAEPLGGRAAYAAPYGRSSSRLLVGPFASAREAQEFVNRLAQREVEAFAWTSAGGQEIERLSTGR